MSDPSQPPSDKFDLRIQPMIHVADLGKSIDFFECLGGEVVFGSRDGDWAQLRFGASCLSLLAHPPSPDNPESVELQLTSGTPLDDVEKQVGSINRAYVARGTGDEAFGRMLQLRTPDGLIVKLLELDRDLIE